MLSKTVFTTEKLAISMPTETFELAVPDIFSNAKAGDVYAFDLSLEVRSQTDTEKCVLGVTVINSYTQNAYGSSQIINTEENIDMNLLFVRFSPVIYTVLTDGVNPLDNGVVHMSIKKLSGSISGLDITAKSLWYKVDRM